MMVCARIRFYFLNNLRSHEVIITYLNLF